MVKRHGGLALFVGFMAFSAFVIILYGNMAAPAAGHEQHEGDSHAVTDLPANWNGYARTDAAKGAAALAEIDRLHNKSIQIHDGYRATFVKSQQDQFTIWIAMTGSEAEARRLQDEMTVKIGGANQMFSQPRLVKIGAYEAYRSEGMGQTHFYYVKGSAVYWIALPPTDATGLATRIVAGL